MRPDHAAAVTDHRHGVQNVDDEKQAIKRDRENDRTHDVDLPSPLADGHAKVVRDIGEVRQRDHDAHHVARATGHIIAHVDRNNIFDGQIRNDLHELLDIRVDVSLGLRARVRDSAIAGVADELRILPKHA